MTQLYTLALLLAAASASPLLARAPNATSNTSMIYDFQNVPTTEDIQYIPCFENFTCTNLEVPLDYDNLDAGTTNVAFIKHTALKQPAKGDIIYNPGGPGGSAVGFIVQDGVPVLSGILGDEWNLIGMDPRGVNNSGPNLDCFKGRPDVRDFYDGQYATVVDARSEPSLRSYFASAGGFGDWCSNALEDDARYANTPAIARDMLHYAELLAASEGNSKENAKVNFFGVSYGSILGNTFAQLYPDRVGKFIIDANMDADDYYRGPWSESLHQSDEAVYRFADTCFEAGPSCPFFHNDSSANSIRDRLDHILADIETAPIAVADPHWVEYPIVVNHMDLRAIIMISMYDTVLWPDLASILSDLEYRNGSSLSVSSGKGLFYPPVAQEYSNVHPKLLIACNDNAGRYNVSTFEELQDLYADHRSRSKYIGDVWPQIIVPQCRNLKFQPPASQRFQDLKKVHTSTPILFTNNAIDPVASSQNKMVQFYEGAVIMLQNATGHGIQTAKSSCTSESVIKYLTTGELPPPGLLCPADMKPFDLAAAA